MMRMTRRTLLTGLAATATLAPLAPARATDPAAARAFIETMGEQLIEILRTAKPGAERAEEFRDLFRRAAALPQFSPMVKRPICGRCPRRSKRLFLRLSKPMRCAATPAASAITAARRWW